MGRELERIWKKLEEDKNIIKIYYRQKYNLITINLPFICTMEKRQPVHQILVQKLPSRGWKEVSQTIILFQNQVKVDQRFWFKSQNYETDEENIEEIFIE